MVISPKIRGFICTTAHPKGCAMNVSDMIEKAKGEKYGVTKNALIIGSSTGYGLASMVTAAFSCDAKTIGVSFDKPAAPEKKRTATAGWYNMAAFAQEAQKAGLEHYSVIGDAFSDQCKDTVVKLIKEKFGKIDMVIYSLASPVRTDPDTGQRYQSVLRPIGSDYTTKSIDLNRWKLTEVTIDPASETEIDETVKVMGGEDWMRWMNALNQAGVLQQDFVSIAYSYIGPKITHAIYKDGTIGRAKIDLQNTADKLNDLTDSGKAYISVNKAVVTQASSAIPAVPLYITLLFKEMKDKAKHEDCIEQTNRMFAKLDSGDLQLDECGRIRMDDWEMEPSIQSAVMERWENATDDNLEKFADIEGFKNSFENLFGFGRNDVNYGEDVEADVKIANSIVL